MLSKNIRLLPLFIQQLLHMLMMEKIIKKYYQNNVIKTKKFILNIKKHKIKNFIFLSSSNVYSEKKICEIFRK